MTTAATSTFKRPLAALGAGTALLLSLTGCLPSVSVDKGAPAPTSLQTRVATPTTQASTQDDSSESTGDATQAGAAGGKAAGTEGKLTPPGTSLAIGEVAITHTNEGKPSDADYKLAKFETKVTKIVAGKESDLAAFKDGAKFAGQVPYYVFSENTLTYLNQPSAGISVPSMEAALKDGTGARTLIVMGSMPQCDAGSFETEGEDDTFSFKVGSSMVNCQVFLAPKGDAVTAVAYDDQGFNYLDYSDNAYSNNPIIWSN
jgi:hypothetical protein